VTAGLACRLAVRPLWPVAPTR